MNDGYSNHGLCRNYFQNFILETVLKLQLWIYFASHVTVSKVLVVVRKRTVGQFEAVLHICDTNLSYRCSPKGCFVFLSTERKMLLVDSFFSQAFLPPWFLFCFLPKYPSLSLCSVFP